jgi:hypothetical protein
MARLAGRKGGGFASFTAALQGRSFRSAGSFAAIIERKELIREAGPAGAGLALSSK